MSETDKVESQLPCGDDPDATSMHEQAPDDFSQLQKNNTLGDVTTEIKQRSCDVADESDKCEAKPEQAGCDEHLSKDNSHTEVKRSDLSLSTDESATDEHVNGKGDDGCLQIQESLDNLSDLKSSVGQCSKDSTQTDEPKLELGNEPYTDRSLELTHHLNLDEKLDCDYEGAVGGIPLSSASTRSHSNNSGLYKHQINDVDDNNHSNRVITDQKHIEESKSPLQVPSSTDETEHESLSLETRWGTPVKAIISACETPEETEKHYNAFRTIEPLTSNDFIMGSCSTGVTFLDEVSQTSNNEKTCVPRYSNTTLYDVTTPINAQNPYVRLSNSMFGHMLNYNSVLFKTFTKKAIGNTMELAMVKIHDAWYHIMNDDKDWARKIVAGVEIIVGQDRALRLAVYKLKSLLALLEANMDEIRKYTVLTLELLQVPFLSGMACNAAWVYVHEALALNCVDPQNWFRRAKDLFQEDTQDLSEAVCGENIATACMNIITNREQGVETPTSDPSETITKFYTDLAKHPVVKHVFDFSHMFI